MSALTSLPTEQFMIGAICSSKGGVIDDYPITAEHFTDPDYALMFEILEDMHRRGKVISDRTFLSRLRETDHKFTNRPSEACDFPYPSEVPGLWEVLNDRMIHRRAYTLHQWLGEASQDKFLAGQDLADQLLQRAADIGGEQKDECVTEATLTAAEENFESIIRGDEQRSIRSPFTAWNDAFGGILPGCMYVLSGRPGAGKNVMVEQMITKMIDEGRPVLMFAKDMSPEMMMDRMVCRRAGVPYWRYVRRVVHGHENAPMKEAFSYYRGVSRYIRISNPPNLTATNLASVVRREARVNGIQCAFLDHFGTLKLGKRDVVEGLTMASVELRTMVNETKIPLVVLAHINRTGAKGKPTAEDIKFCDQLYGDCDGMAMLWTDQDKTEVPYGEKLKMYMSITKNRCGPMSDNTILFDGTLLNFHNED